MFSTQGTSVVLFGIICLVLERICMHTRSHGNLFVVDISPEKLSNLAPWHKFTHFLLAKSPHLKSLDLWKFTCTSAQRTTALHYSAWDRITAAAGLSVICSWWPATAFNITAETVVKGMQSFLNISQTMQEWIQGSRIHCHISNILCLLNSWVPARGEIFKKSRSSSSC